MSWFIEYLHRDGSVLARMPVPYAAESARTFRIGRALDNDLVLDDPHCAPYHAKLEIDANGVARLHDLGTSNGIVGARNKRATVHEIKTDDPYRLGQSLVRVRASDWPLMPERVLSRRAVWPYALAGLALALAHCAWDLWLRDVQEKSPTYLYSLSGLALLLCLWSSMYTLFGRLVAGENRFFSHLLIACIGYLAGTLVLNFLETLAFTMSWLWPARITEPVVVVIAAMTVRQHLRLADPRHWPTLRIGLVIVATLAIVVPLAQQWISHQRLTDIQTLHAIEHPALRLASPVPLPEFSVSVDTLKARVDKARKKDDAEGDGNEIGSDLGND